MLYRQGKARLLRFYSDVPMDRWDLLESFWTNLAQHDERLQIDGAGILPKKDPLFIAVIAVIVVVPKKETGGVNLEPNLPVVTCKAKAHPAEHLPPWPSFLGYVRIPLPLMAEIQQWPVGGLVPFVHLIFCRVSYIPGFQVQV